MEYREGKIGRIFYLKFSDGDDFLAKLKKFAVAEKIKFAEVKILGAVKKTDVVVGPKNSDMPPEPLWMNIDTPKEIVGFGTIIWDEAEPVPHIHSLFSYNDKAFIGCIRKEMNVFIIIEAVVYEILGIKVQRKYNDKNGIKLAEFL